MVEGAERLSITLHREYVRGGRDVPSISSAAHCLPWSLEQKVIVEDPACSVLREPAPGLVICYLTLWQPGEEEMKIFKQ